MSSIFFAMMGGKVKAEAKVMISLMKKQQREAIVKGLGCEIP